MRSTMKKAAWHGRGDGERWFGEQQQQQQQRGKREAMLSDKRKRDPHFRAKTRPSASVAAARPPMRVVPTGASVLAREDWGSMTEPSANSTFDDTTLASRTRLLLVGGSPRSGLVHALVCMHIFVLPSFRLGGSIAWGSPMALAAGTHPGAARGGAAAEAAELRAHAERAGGPARDVPGRGGAERRLGERAPPQGHGLGEARVKDGLLGLAARRGARGDGPWEFIGQELEAREARRRPRRCRTSTAAVGFIECRSCADAHTPG